MGDSPSMGTFPAPETLPGQPFKDPNLKLVVLENLLDQELIELGTPEELASHLLGRKVDLENEGYELIPECLDYLHRYPLSRDLLSRVNAIVIDGGLEIYEYAFYFWGGNFAVFDIDSLDGIEHCPNVTSYWESAMCHDGDLSRLAQLNKLKTISLGLRTEDDQYRNMESLLALPALESLTLFDNAVEAQAARDVISSLEAKGVEVRVF